MEFDPALIEGRLVRRYKRFLADIELADGRLITASCPNTGSMAGLLDEGNRVWVSYSDSKTRKYAHTWQIVECSRLAHAPRVGINTHLPNALVAAALEAGAIEPLEGYDTVRREVKYGDNSRIDLLLEGAGRRPCYVEIKNVTLSRAPPLAEFPDTRTARGTKHLKELANMVGNGARAVMFYLVQRDDAETFKLAGDIDPAYFDAYNEASEGGVETLAWACKVAPTGISLARQIPIEVAGE